MANLLPLINTFSSFELNTSFFPVVGRLALGNLRRGEEKKSENNQLVVPLFHEWLSSGELNKALARCTSNKNTRERYGTAKLRQDYKHSPEHISRAQHTRGRDTNL